MNAIAKLKRNGILRVLVLRDWNHAQMMGSAVLVSAKVQSVARNVIIHSAVFSQMQ
jgi:hypothetical protein